MSQGPSSTLILLARRGRGVRERPHSVLELQHQKAIILAGGPERAALGIEMGLRRAPVGAARNEVVAESVIGAATGRRHAGRIVIGNLLRPPRIADVEDADT